MDNSSSISSRLGNIIKGGVAAVAAGVLALSCAVGAPQAYATDVMSTSYALPSASEVKTFEHTATDAAGNKYDYEFVTIGTSSTARVAPMYETWYEAAGLNYVNAYCGVGSIFQAGDDDQITERGALNPKYTEGTTGSLKTTNSTLAIQLNNEQPDEYIWNYMCWANGATVDESMRAVNHGNSSKVGTIACSVSIGGTLYKDFPREIYTECNVLNTNNLSTKYGSAEGQSYTYTRWIALENQRENRPHKTDFYDPYYVEYAITGGGSASTMVKTLYTLADTIDKVVVSSADANGNYTLRSRYGGNSATGTRDAISNYEDIVQAPQYYALSKIESGATERAVTAVLVGYDPVTKNYACRKYNASTNVVFVNANAPQRGTTEGTQSDPETNYYGGRVANYCSPISMSVADLGLPAAQDPYNNGVEANFVEWLTAEQIVKNADAVFVCDCPSDNTISAYLATASDGSVYTVSTPSTVRGTGEDHSADLIAANNALPESERASLCLSYPANMFGNFYAQGMENGMLGFLVPTFTYPSVFTSQDLTDLFGYWAKNVWHISSGTNNATLQSVVEAATATMSTSGLSVGTVSSNYAATCQKIFDEGNKFYIAHATEIDGINGGSLKSYSVDDLIARTSGAPAKDSGNALMASAGKQGLTGTANYVKTYGSGAFSIDAKAANGAKLTYGSSKSAVATVNASGKVTIKGAGTTVITVTAPANASGSIPAETLEVTVKVNKAAQPMTVSATTKTQKIGYTALKAKKRSVNTGISVKKNQGAVGYAVKSVSKSKYKSKFAVASNGKKITVAKGTPKGTYKVTLRATAKGNANYAKGSKDAVVTIKIS